MAESNAENIMEALRTSLAAIVSDNGTTYWYTPSRVVRHHDFDETILDPTLQTVYVLVPDEESTERVSSCDIRSELRVFLMLCYRHERSTINPYQAKPPILGTLQNRMLKDVEKKLSGSPIVGASYGVTDVLFERKDRSAFTAKWALAGLQLNVKNNYTFGAP